MVEHVLESLPVDGRLSAEQLTAFIALQVDRVDRAGGRLLLDTPREHLAAISRWQRWDDLAWVGMMRAVAAALDAVDAATPVPEQLQERLMSGAFPGERTLGFFTDEVGLAVGASPRTGGDLAGPAVQAVSVPGLVEAVEQGLLTRRHALAALRVLPGVAGELQVPVEVQTAVLLVALGRFAGHTPAEFARLLRRLLHLTDPTLTAKREIKRTAERGVWFRELEDGQAILTAVGPALQVAAIRASLEAALTEHENSSRPDGHNNNNDDDDRSDSSCDDSRRSCDSSDSSEDSVVLFDPETGEVLPPDFEGQDQHDKQECEERNRGARRFDVFTALLTGGTSAPEHWVVDLLVPYSVTQDGEWELAEVPGLGHVLPQTARDLTALAGATRRIAVRGLDPLDPHDGQDGQDGQDANPATGRGVGRVLDVSDLQAALSSIAAHRRTGRPQQADTPPLTEPDSNLAAAAEALAATPLRLRDLSSEHYVPPGRLARFVEHRDRTCVFPGCHQPAARTDKDHRLAWPTGPTTADNLQCLCRRHHQAKQAMWQTRDDPENPDGTVLWTSRITGHTYTRPAQGY